MPNKTSNDSQAIAGQLHSVSIHLLRKLRREDAGSDLNAPRLSALSVIVLGGPLTLGELAAAEQVRPSTMSRIVSALKEQGLVATKQNADDGRSAHLTATAAGRRLLIRGRQRRVHALAVRIDGLTVEKRIALRKAAEILKEVVRSI